jgi:hypothetical protein
LAAGILALAATACHSVRDQSTAGELSYCDVWRSLLGQDMTVVTLWATPSQVASPSLCFEPKAGGEYRVETVASDHVILRTGAMAWIVPLSAVQLRLPDR